MMKIALLSAAVVFMLSACGILPLTRRMAARRLPAVALRTYRFRVTLLVLDMLWVAACLAGASLASLFPEGYAGAAAWSVPPLFLAGVLSPVVVRLLPQYVRERYKPATCRELFELMPHGLNRRYARRLNRTLRIGFSLSGEEPIRGVLAIEEGRCRFCETDPGEAETRLACDSRLWLDIANGKADPARASLEERLLCRGDATVLRHLTPLFSTGLRCEEPFPCSVPKTLYEEFRNVEHKPVSKIVIFYSGLRRRGISKTLFMARAFARGVRETGGEAEIVHLARKRIRPCLGCYTCWTATPGTCVLEDDMHELAEKYLSADMVVYASPLYIFSVNGPMKNFMDRLLPLLEPYMLRSEKGHTLHPDRFPKRMPSRHLVISAGGFPEVEENFDTLRGLYRQWCGHTQHGVLCGELLLPAAELLSRPEFADRREAVREACREAGRQVVCQGYPEPETMRRVSDIGISRKQFRRMADTFWSCLDGRKAYMKEIPNIDTDNDTPDKTLADDKS